MQQNLGFISDLHLSPQQSGITAIFEHYIQNKAINLAELYILGDLFDYWIGDDYDQEYNQHILTILKQLTKSTKVFFMPGNRDFLITQEELARYNITLLADPSIITIAGKNILLTHGDQFCTLDRGYQRMRKIFQHHYTKQAFLHLPLQMRSKVATTTRTISNNENNKKNLAKLWTVTETVLAAAKKYDADIIIHGHTHNKQIDNYNLDEKPITRIIMPSWETGNGSELTLDKHAAYKFKEISL